MSIKINVGSNDPNHRYEEQTYRVGQDQHRRPTTYNRGDVEEIDQEMRELQERMKQLQNKKQQAQTHQQGVHVREPDREYQILKVDTGPKHSYRSNDSPRTERDGYGDHYDRRDSRGVNHNNNTHHYGTETRVISYDDRRSPRSMERPDAVPGRARGQGHSPQGHQHRRKNKENRSPHGSPRGRDTSSSSSSDSTSDGEGGRKKVRRGKGTRRGGHGAQGRHQGTRRSPGRRGSPRRQGQDDGPIEIEEEPETEEQRREKHELERAFKTFASKYGGMPNSSEKIGLASNTDLTKWCKDAGILNNSTGLNMGDVDIAYARVKQRGSGSKYLTLNEMPKVLDELMAKMGKGRHSDTKEEMREMLTHKLAQAPYRLHGVTNFEDSDPNGRIAELAKYHGRDTVTHYENYRQEARKYKQRQH